MKKLLSILLVMCLFLPSALAGLDNDTYHTPQSVVDTDKNISTYSQFKQSGEFSILTPGLAETFVPQGLAFYSPQNLMFFSGYDYEGYASALIASDINTGWVIKEMFFTKPDGSFYTDHFGGVCVTDKNIFIAGERSLYRLSLSEFFAADISEARPFTEVIPVPCGTSYCQISNGILWVGEFNYDREAKFKSDPNHHVTNAEGETLKSWILGYKLVNYTENEFDPASITANGAIPDYILAVTDRVQGLTFSNNQIYLSQSYGRTNDSHLYRYENVLGKDPDMKVSVLGVPCPLWFLDSQAETGSLLCPPMTEGLCTIGDSVYVSFESASGLYRIPYEPKKGRSKNPVDRVYKLNPAAF